MRSLSRQRFLTTALQAFTRVTPWFRGKGRLLRVAYRAGGDTEIVAGFRVKGKVVHYFVRLGSMIEEAALLRGIYEPNESAVIDRFARPDCVSLDVGANVGLHTLRLACLSKGVIALEPNVETRARLYRNLELNRFANVEVRPEAVGESWGTAILYVNSPDCPNRNATMVCDTHPDVMRKPVLVPVVSIDSLAVQERVGFTKLDIEGYELAALRGARGTIQRDRPAVMSEFSSHFARQLGYSPFDMLSELEGYAIYVIGRRGKLERAKKFDRDGAASLLFVP